MRNRSRLISVVLALVLLVLAVTPAFAADGGRGLKPTRAKTFMFIGTVISVDTETLSFVMKAVRGNQPVRNGFPKEVTIVTNEQTKLCKVDTTAKTCTPITLADLKADDTVLVGGWQVESKYLARRVTVGIPSPAKS